MPSLSHVYSSLEVNTVGLDPASVESPIGSPVTIDFPSLVYVAAITLQGNLSRCARLAYLLTSPESSHSS